jgi:hypothetical protein
LDGEYYYAHDANYNVTAVLNASGSVSNGGTTTPTATTAS